MNSPLADIGADLRQAREARNRSIEDLSHETLIHVRHLLALEDGRDADLPEPFYVKNFIRKYANAVGLSGDTMANRYWDTRPLPEHPPRPPSGPDFIVPWWVFPAMLGALLLGAIGTFAVMNGNKAPTTLGPSDAGIAASGSLLVGGATESAGTASVAAATESVAAATESATGTAAVATPSEVATAAVAASPEATAAVAVEITPTPGPLNLPPLVVPGREIAFQTHNKEAAWMLIVADGREIYSGVMPKNMIRTWTASRSLAVRIGKPGVVTGRLGGRPLGALGPKDAPVFRRTFLTRDGELALRHARAGNQPAARPTPGPKLTPPPAPLEKVPTAAPPAPSPENPGEAPGTSSDQIAP
ncbi:MAG: DUF4115 domain-containing protein [Candidatus Sericytochromatia bacterium]|nr:DUF4115 domain-containing protein [Candidatus Tanganyikabacteria bacterium]